MNKKTKTGNQLPKVHKLSISTLGPSWHDNDEVMLHACFQLLTSFMDEGSKLIDWTEDAEHRKAWKEMKALYKWWTVTRPNRKDPYFDKFMTLHQTDIVITPKQEKQLNQLAVQSGVREIKWLDEDQKNLHRLIEVRPYLWV